MTTSQVGGAAPRQAALGRLPRMYRADGSPIRALLVDDERALTNLVQMALKFEGWTVDVAHDAVKRDGDGLLGERLGDRFGNLATGYAEPFVETPPEPADAGKSGGFFSRLRGR